MSDLIDSVNARMRLVDNPEHIPEDYQEEPWEAAVREKIAHLAQGKLTVKRACLISEFAKKAGDLIAVTRNEAPLRSTVTGSMGFSSLGDYSYVPNIPNASETFGAKVLKEIMAAADRFQKKKDPAALVRAIAEARELGLDDVATKLEAELSGDDEPEVPPADAAAIDATADAALLDPALTVEAPAAEEATA